MWEVRTELALELGPRERIVFKSRESSSKKELMRVVRWAALRKGDVC